MLEPDVRQVDDRRVEDVRRVEPAAEPGLDRGDVDALGGELGERGSRQRLELRRPQPLGRRPDAADGTLEALGVGVEPLLPARDVRRRVRADTQPFLPQQRGDRPRGRRLAVGADNVDGGNARSGWPSSSSSARIRSRPNSSGHGESDSIQAVCGPITGNVDDSCMHAYR